MATVTVDGDIVRVALQGMDKVWALKGGVEIPLAHIRAVTVAPAGLKPKGLRAPGTALPGLFYAGTWRGRGTKEFWIVRDKAKALVIDLEGDEYTRVAVEVDDPAAVSAEIERARRASRGVIREARQAASAES